MEQIWHVPVSLTGTYWSATLAVGAESADAAEEAAIGSLERLTQENLESREFKVGTATACAS